MTMPETIHALTTWHRELVAADVVLGPYGLDVVLAIEPAGPTVAPEHRSVQLRHGHVVRLAELREPREAIPDLPAVAFYHRASSPTVNVKDRAYWEGDRETRCVTDRGDDVGNVAEVIRELEAAGIDVQAIYDASARMFWDHYAPEAALEAGFSERVYSEGRSSGWVYPDGPRPLWPDYIVDDASELRIPSADDTGDDHDHGEYRQAQRDRDRFLLFAAGMADAMSETAAMYASELANAMADLTARREACITKGEN